MDDPIVKEMVRFTLRHGRWIAAAFVVAVIGSAISGLTKPAMYEMRAVYTTATTATEGPVESFELAVRRATGRVAEAVASGELPAGTTLDAHGLMGEPPNLETTHLLEMYARGLDANAVRRAIELAGEELTRGAQPVAAIDQQRIKRHMGAVAADLARLERLSPTRERHDLFVKEVRELVDTGRFASPVRAYEARFLGVFEPVREERLRKLTLPLALGVSGGIAGGYALAFLIAGAGAFARHRRRASPA